MGVRLVGIGVGAGFLGEGAEIIVRDYFFPSLLRNMRSFSFPGLKSYPYYSWTNLSSLGSPIVTL